jgi:hypothetical protein
MHSNILSSLVMLVNVVEVRHLMRPNWLYPAAFLQKFQLSYVTVHNSQESYKVTHYQLLNQGASIGSVLV